MNDHSFKEESKYAAPLFLLGCKMVRKKILVQKGKMKNSIMRLFHRIVFVSNPKDKFLVSIFPHTPHSM